jgi:hypothetical protein
VRDGMESCDEFNQFVMNEVIDSSSSDDENDLFFGAAHMITEDSVNHPGRERLLHHGLLYKDYFSENPTFKAKTFRRRFVCFL